MQRTALYRQYAKECQTLAETWATGDGRAQLLKIAAAWEELAQKHEKRAGDHSALASFNFRVA